MPFANIQLLKLVLWLCPKEKLMKNSTELNGATTNPWVLWHPVPYINVYGATKAFVLSFSRALNAEVQDRGIRVMAVCPGWVRTEFFDHAVNDDTIKYYNKFFEPEEVVKTAMKDMKKGKDVSVCGFSVKAQVLAVKFLPHKTVMRIWLKQQQKL